MRMKCWNCEQHGHLGKGCKDVAAVTDENEERYDDWTNDVTEYYDEDRMDYGWNDNWTWHQTP